MSEPGRLRGALGRLMRRRRAAVAPALPAPDRPLAVIGDIHGRADLLDQLLQRLAREAPGARLVTVGDYVDRGAESRAVIARLRGLDGALCLRGNHEQMLLDFLDAPIEAGARWLRNGGVATLASYGIALDVTGSHDDIMRARDTLRAAMADDAAWLAALPLFWQSGDVLICHAGPDPALPVPGQPDEHFLWGHPRFLRDARADGLWVAHGHWIQERAHVRGRRIAVDTGAWHSGRLSAAVLVPGRKPRFVVARGPGR